MPRRVRRNKGQEAVYKALKDGEAGVFETYKDVFMMAACLGFKHGVREPFESSAEPIEWDVFHGKTDAPIVNAIALLETGDMNILLDDDETFDRKLLIVEEFASGGMHMLKQRVLDAPGDSLDNLVALMYEQRPESAKSNGALEDLVDELFKQ